MASERRKWPGKPPQELLDRPDIADMFHWSQPPEMAICFAEIAKGCGLPDNVQRFKPSRRRRELRFLARQLAPGILRLGAL